MGICGIKICYLILDCILGTENNCSCFHFWSIWPCICDDLVHFVFLIDIASPQLINGFGSKVHFKLGFWSRENPFLLSIKTKQNKTLHVLWDFLLSHGYLYFPTCLEWVRTLLTFQGLWQWVFRESIIFISENCSVSRFPAQWGHPFL